MAGIFDPACELLPPRTKELYLCSVAPLPVAPLLPPPFSKLNVQCVAVGGGFVELCCRPYSAGVLHSVSDQIQNLQIASPPPTKMTSKGDI